MIQSLRIAYNHLLRRVRPALATSYAYVNPPVAVALRVWLAGERIGGSGLLAMIVILAITPPLPLNVI